MMKKWLPLAALLLAMMLLVTACGADKDVHKKPEKDDIDYQDFITPVVDRKVTDCITEAQISSLVGVPMQFAGSEGDAVANYQSEDASMMITLMLENKNRAEFETIVTESEVMWVMQEGLGEAAYWSEDRTELIAYADGYAASVSAYGVEEMVMYHIMQQLMNGLQQQ